MAADPRDALNKARSAFKAGHFAEALEQYEHFFEHALDDDPAALYGVRLSYCLAEWASLGEHYPRALERLREKAAGSLDLLTKTREPERFHDFIAICKHLKRTDEPIRQFLVYHSSDSDLAKSIVRFVWAQLVERKLWSICSEYLPDPGAKYELAIAKFDQAMEVCASDPSLGGNDFAEQIKEWYVRDVTNLLLVLTNTGRVGEAAKVRASMVADMGTRGYPQLIGVVDAGVSSNE
ncbi:MAG: hypothetical protein AB1651_18045 [Pseudomonadota bacterium]|jgi:tetratricopeptide (TPR) repeat protein